MIGPVERSEPQYTDAAAAGWDTTLAKVTPMMQGTQGTGGAAPGPVDSLLGGTVTPDQVRRGMAKFMPEAAVDGAFAAAITRRAAGGQALRAMIADHVASGAPGTAAVARQLTAQVAAAEPAWAAGPAVRSLMRASDAGQLRMDAAGAAVLARFFEGHGYGPEMAAGLPNGLPFNITEADHDAAQLMARAGGAWHPDATHTKPAEARVRISIMDEGFNMSHPLLATKVVPAAHREAGRTNKDTPYTHPPASAKEHGTAMVAIATGRTHVTEAVGIRTMALSKRTFDYPHLTKRAAEEATIVSQSLAPFLKNPSLQAKLGDAQAVALRRNPGTLLIQAAGNREAGRTEARAIANLALSRERTVLTVGGHFEPDGLNPDAFVGHPALVHTLAPVTAFAPQVSATQKMAVGQGTSIATASVANLAAAMSALAPHLPAPRLKGLIEATSISSLALMMANPKQSAFGMVNRPRALRLAAVAGLVVSGNAGALRTVTIATPGGAARVREQGPVQAMPGMTAEQAVDALRLTGTERAQALADHAALCAA